MSVSSATVTQQLSPQIPQAQSAEPSLPLPQPQPAPTGQLVPQRFEAIEPKDSWGCLQPLIDCINRIINAVASLFSCSSDEPDFYIYVPNPLQAPERGEEPPPNTPPPSPVHRQDSSSSVPELILSEPPHEEPQLPLAPVEEAPPPPVVLPPLAQAKKRSVEGIPASYWPDEGQKKTGYNVSLSRKGLDRSLIADYVAKAFPSPSKQERPPLVDTGSLKANALMRSARSADNERKVEGSDEEGTPKVVTPRRDQTNEIPEQLLLAKGLEKKANVAGTEVIAALLILEVLLKNEPFKTDEAFKGHIETEFEARLEESVECRTYLATIEDSEIVAKAVLAFKTQHSDQAARVEIVKGLLDEAFEGLVMKGYGQLNEPGIADDESKMTYKELAQIMNRLTELKMARVPLNQRVEVAAALSCFPDTQLRDVSRPFHQATLQGRTYSGHIRQGCRELLKAENPTGLLIEVNDEAFVLIRRNEQFYLFDPRANKEGYASILIFEGQATLIQYVSITRAPVGEQDSYAISLISSTPKKDVDDEKSDGE